DATRFLYGPPEIKILVEKARSNPNPARTLTSPILLRLARYGWRFHIFDFDPKRRTSLNGLASDNVKIKRFRTGPNHVIGNLDCYFMPTPGKFGVFDEHTRRSWRCVRKYPLGCLFRESHI